MSILCRCSVIARATGDAVSDMAQSNYFAMTKTGEKLFYSYENCGSADTYSAKACEDLGADKGAVLVAAKETAQLRKRLSEDSLDDETKAVIADILKSRAAARQKPAGEERSEL